MTTDVGFLYAMAGVSMSVASIAGLVVAFRRTGTWAALDIYRLRQIAEWGFVNAVFALAAFPLATLFGGEAAAIRVLGSLALAYLALNMLLLMRRRVPVRAFVPLTFVVVLVDVTALTITTATIIVAAMAAWELALLALLLRPMTAFLLVLSTLRVEGERS